MFVLFALACPAMRSTGGAGSEATATSPDGMVTVTVGQGAAVTGLDLGRRAIARHGRSLGPVIVATIQAASRRAGEHVAARDAARGRELTTTGAGGPVDVFAPLERRPPAPADDTLLRDAPESVRVLAADAERHLARYRSTLSELDGLRVTKRSSGGEVQVTVRAGGAVEDVTLGESALRCDPADLGALVLVHVHSATAEAARQLVERVNGMTRDLTGGRPRVPAQPTHAHALT